MKVPFLDLKQQWLNLKEEIKPEILKVFESGVFIGGGNFVRPLRDKYRTILKCGMQLAVTVVRMR